MDPDTSLKTPPMSQEKLKNDLTRLLNNTNTDLDCHGLQSCSPASLAMYKTTLQQGVKSLLDTNSDSIPNANPNHQDWTDAMTYARQAILSPQDSSRRATSYWIRSTSALHKTLITRFGPSTITAARRGVESIISNHFNGHRATIPHVNKKASYLRHRHSDKVGAVFFPPANPLTAACFQVAMLPASLALSAYFPVQKAVLAGYLSHTPVCDDYAGFTKADYEVRVRMVALAAGAARQLGGKAVNVLVDGSALQAVGIGTGVENSDMSVDAALAWRAVGGCATLASRFNFCEDDDDVDVEESLVMPMVIMAMHDLLDWRCDTAAGNHENGISAAYGFGIANPFHTYLEAVLRKVLSSPRGGLYAIATITYMHFTVSRYGAWEYHGHHGSACANCVDLLRSATVGSGLEWAPKPPPESYSDGDEPRERGKLWTDQFIDTGLVQEAASWFQYLICSGKIWLFDLLAEGVDPVDDGTDWAQQMCICMHVLYVDRY